MDRGEARDPAPMPVPPATPNDPDYDAIGDLLNVLDLKALGDDEFEGRSQRQPHGRVFGGQVLAQALVAAGRTVADLDGFEQNPRYPHSMHAYFLRPGDDTKPIRFTVERLRDGRSFSARRVHAVQEGRPILSLAASFQTPDEGLDHQDVMPEVPAPEDLPAVGELLAQVTNGPAKKWVERRAIDIRHAEGPIYLQPSEEQTARQNVWIRAVGQLPDDPLLHAAVLAYASDYTLLEPVLRRNGLTWIDPRLRVASLDHAMWFHRPIHADDWLLYSQSSPSAKGGRGLGIGRMFNRDGQLLASVAQEGMLRLKE
ncbi:acyl-CoA thioesterase [Kineosphaera limosa NBRC 100340]|uniref:Acyl-CoA thioesterase 2 n=2 Tax=Kineosphaera TaxID=211469 RepID=K6XHN8_9MICO|nr:acyl-CoA thioesterase [Kineosphaera limosa NBRC 100340]